MSVIALRIGDGVAEEVEEEGLGEGVELGEGGAALGPQRLRPVQHLRNPPLLRQWRQGDYNFGCISLGTSLPSRRAGHERSFERRVDWF